MMLWFNSLGQPGGEPQPASEMRSGEHACIKENQRAFARERTDDGQDTQVNRPPPHIEEDVLDRQTPEISGLV